MVLIDKIKFSQKNLIDSLKFLAFLDQKKGRNVKKQRDIKFWNLVTPNPDFFFKIWMISSFYFAA